MTKKTKDIQNVKKSHHFRRTIAAFWICLLLVFAPIVILGWMLVSTYMDTGSPVFGHRYDGDLDPAITKENISTIEDSVSSIEGIESDFTNLSSATLRVYAKVADDATADVATAKAQEIYTAVSAVLEPSVYFTKADGKKMYDLEIHVYNLDEDQDRTADNFVYVIETKTSNMSEPSAQTVSEARFPELAQRLRDDVAARKAAEEAAAQATPTPEASAAPTEQSEE